MTWTWIVELRHASWVGAGIVLLLVVAEAWRLLGQPPVEHTRKLVHIGSGLTALSFGWLFHSHWTVLGLCLLFGLLMLATRRMRLLPSVHGVERHSRGALLFPLAIYLTFVGAVLAARPLYYFIAIGLLTLSDSFAALVGTRYGSARFSVEEERKSLEGSVIFFLTSFLIVHLALLFGSGLRPLHTVLIGCWIAAMVTAFEAISCHGADNLWVPLGTTYLLWKIVPKPTEVLVTELVTLATCVALCFLLLAPRRTLDHTAILGVALLLDGAYRLLDWSWAVPLLTAILLLAWSGASGPAEPAPRFRIRAVFYAGIGLLLWLVLSNLRPPDDRAAVLVPYLSSILALLSIGWSTCQSGAGPGRRRLQRLVVLSALLLLPQLFAHRELLQPASLAALVGGAALADLAWAHLTQARLAHLCRVGRVRLAGMLTLAFSGALYLVRGVVAR